MQHEYLYFRLTYICENVISSKLNSIRFLQDQGVIPRQMLCPGPLISGKRYGGCRNPMLIKDVKDRKDSMSWRCRRTHKVEVNGRTYCNKDVKVTIRKGTWLQHCNLTLEEIILLLYCWANDFTTEQITHEVGCSEKTSIEWSCFLRESCMSLMLDSSEKIGGQDIEIEIDESKFGRRKYYKGHRVEGQWIFGGREKKDKSKVFMLPVHDRKKETLLPLIERYIKKGSIIHSDCWAAYNEIPKMGYKHLTVNHSKMFKNKRTGACTNAIESDWRHAKVSMPRYGVKKGKHASYLAEFMWRRKYCTKDLFVQIIKDLNGHFIKKYITSIP